MSETTDKLVAALREAGAPSGMIRDAEAHTFHDFLGKSAMPINDLVELAKQYGLIGIVRRAMDGEFDATRKEAENWASSEAGKSILADFGNGR